MADDMAYEIAEDSEVTEQVATGSKRGQDTEAGGDDSFPAKRHRPEEPEDHVKLRMLLPSRAVGAVIGSGGETIQRLRTEFSARLNIPDSQGPERILIIGAALENISGILSDLLPRLERDLEGSIDSDEIEVRVLVHQSHAGRIIGKGGEKVKKFRKDSGAHIKVFVEVCPHSTEKVIQIAGQKEQVISCVQIILEDLSETEVKGICIPYNPDNADENYSFEYGGYTSSHGRGGGFGGRGRGGGFRGRPPMGGYGYDGGMMGMEDDYYGGYMDEGFGFGGFRGRGAGRMMGGFRGRRGGRGGGVKTTAEVTIPKFLAGAVMGKGGNRIKEIQAESGAMIRLDQQDVEGDERVISIMGYPDQIQYAKHLLQQSARGRGGRILY